MKILIISDLQFPYHHPDALDFLREVKNQTRPDRVVCIGDLVDLHTASQYTKNPNLFSPKEELAQSRKYIAQLVKLFPKVDMLTGNHDLRIDRTIQEAGLPSDVAMPFDKVFNLPKTWKMHRELEIDDILFRHDFSTVSILNAVRQYGQSCVQGHWHTKFETQFSSNRKHLLWGMTVGCLIDPHSAAFDYARNSSKTSKLARPIIGTGVIVNGLPCLVPMVLDKHGRWIKAV